MRWKPLQLVLDEKVICLFCFKYFTAGRLACYFKLRWSTCCEWYFSVGAGVWCAVIGVLLLLWVLVGLKRLEKINMVAMTALFLMTLVLCFVIVTRGNFGTLFNGSSVNKDVLTFGAAIELSAAMPLSWIPVISDYTSNSTKTGKGYCSKYHCLLSGKLLDVSDWNVCCDWYGNF